MTSSKPSRSSVKFDFQIVDELPNYMGTSAMPGASKYDDLFKIITDHIGLKDGASHSPWVQFLFDSTGDRTSFQSSVHALSERLGAKEKGWKYQTRTDKKDPCVLYVRKIAI